MLLIKLVLILLTCVVYSQQAIDIIDYDQFSNNDFEILSKNKFYILLVCKFV